MSNQPPSTTLDSPLISPFPENIPVEIIAAILSFASTSTLIAACGASFALLSLAAPLLYGNDQVDGHDVSKMIYHRYLPKPPSYPPPSPPAPPLSNESRLLPYLSSLPLTIAAIRRSNGDRVRPRVWVDTLVIRLGRDSAGVRFSSVAFALLHPRRIVFCEPFKLRSSKQPEPIMVAWTGEDIGRDHLQEVRIVNQIQVTLVLPPMAPSEWQSILSLSSQSSDWSILGIRRSGLARVEVDGSRKDGDVVECAQARGEGGGSDGFGIVGGVG